MKEITREQIVFDLKLAGIEPGDIVFLHSALSSIGKVQGGADTVIDAFLEAVGPQGTFAVSTLSFEQPFDAATTPSTVGIISETLRKRPGACRSLSPIHSIAAIGKDAVYLTEGHEKLNDACGLNSPYLRLRDIGAKIVLLGVDMNRNTTLHSLESMMDSVYLEDRVVKAPTYMDGYEGKNMTLVKFPPGHRDFLRFTPVLRRADALIEGRVGDARMMVIDVRRMFGLGLQQLADNPMFFMCENEACEYCKNAHDKFLGRAQA